jgi:hypothetical protein
MPFVERRFTLLCLLLLAILAAVQILSIREESQTWDEAIHLAAGYSYWKTGDFRLNPEHPPLGKLLNALPLLWLNLNLPLDHPSWAKPDQREFGLQFLYYNRLPADEILFRARLVTIVVSLALGAAIAWWTRRRFGPPAALTALTFFVFDPNFIAHGRYVTSDVFVSFFSFLACALAADYLITARRRFLWLAGSCTGLAVASKFSALFLVLALPALWWLKGRCDRQFPGWKRLGHDAAVLALTALLICAAVYAPELKRLVPSADNARLTRLADAVNPSTAYGRTVSAISRSLDLPVLTLPVAIGLVLDHDRLGHPSYLCGKVRDKGRWYYFPAAFAVKAPTALLAALALSALILLWKKWRNKLPTCKFEHWAMLAPALMYLWVGMGSGINIGIRHLLPALPFLFVLLGAALTCFDWSGRKTVVALLLILLAVESVAVYPHYLAFFNWLSGGPANGRRWLVDSNLDWGQDLIRLKKYLDQNGIRSLSLCYFGTAPASYYGIPEDPVPVTAQVGDPSNLNTVIAISVTPLQGVYTAPEDFAWLRNRQPTARIGYSIHVYDFRKNSTR